MLSIAEEGPPLHHYIPAFFLETNIFSVIKSSFFFSIMVVHYSHDPSMAMDKKEKNTKSH